MATNYQVVIKVKGSREFRERYKKFGASLLNLRPALQESGKMLKKFFSGEVFVSRGQVLGHPWQPLNDAYAAEKAREFPGRPPLIRTGAMNRGYAYETNPTRVFLFNKQFYFRFHQNGEGVPQRLTMGLDQARINQVQGFIEKNIADNMEKFGV